MAKTWTVDASEERGQLLAQMSALRDDVREDASAESNTSSFTQKVIRKCMV